MQFELLERCPSYARCTIGSKGGYSIAKTTPKRHWSPSEGSFRRRLGWLDQGVDSKGEGYLEMRRRLVRYFDRKNCPEPDDLADETLNRVARRLEETDAAVDDSPARYCYVVARFVFLESLRQPRLEALGVDLGDELPLLHVGVEVGVEGVDLARDLAAHLHLHDGLEGPGRGDDGGQGAAPLDTEDNWQIPGEAAVLLAARRT